MRVLLSAFLFLPSLSFAAPAEGLITWEQYHYLGGFAGITVALLLWMGVLKALL